MKYILLIKEEYDKIELTFDQSEDGAMLAMIEAIMEHTADSVECLVRTERSEEGTDGAGI